MSEQQYIIDKIRSQYVERHTGPLEELKALDRKVKRPPTVFACVWGSISALIMGAGMSLVMTDLAQILSIPSPMPIGIAAGLLGLGMALLTWPIYKSSLRRRKQKYAPQVLALSQQILEQEEL